MTKPPIIGLTGPIGAGKTTVARALIPRGYTRMPMAAYLKKMLRALGLDGEQLDGELKETPSEILCGKTPRHAMQTLGTEWRNMIGEDLWLNAWQADWFIRGKPLVVIDDVRFPHEADMVRAYGGTIWRVERSGIGGGHTHASEAHTLPYDLIFRNDGPVNQVQELVDDIISIRYDTTEDA